MGTAFQKMLGDYYSLLHKRAVYMTTVQFLRRYCSTDLGSPQETIRVEDQVSVAVPEDVVGDVIRELESVVLTLDLELKTFGEEKRPVKKVLPKRKAAGKKK